MIPEIKQTAVKEALEETFGVSECEDIRLITRGLSSALVFRIVVKGKPYLLRIITRTDAMGDPTIQFANMKVAAENGLAPKVWYTSTEDRISITDFVDAEEFSLEEARNKLPMLIRRLHSLPPFPKIVNYRDVMNGFIKKVQEAKILPESVTEELFKQYTRIINIYPWNPENLVSCHNDLKPENIIFDGEKVWLVDWEASFLNDRYMDLAVVANFLVKDDLDESEYLANYFGRPANEYEKAQFFLARQMMHVYYFAIFALYGSKGNKIDPNPEKIDFSGFHDRIWTGEISLASDDRKLQYAWIHMEEALQNMRTKRFEEAVNIINN